ncbi:peptidylprolyl isomerase [Psittacicella gerlachiana]|uniref:Peptidyl-prolyl cis-trans isomerase n=1 Tax=Psittacicella gerlachiana TaxID=2028574 RepID=A0A3A1YKJ8_9GAMM|nr:peptidylprolyl isomerase [Psittacicella gerlachiana]RIY36764.1 hypothetical protein CKF59_02300 [Psittacicella gerlachiana]
MSKNPHVLMKTNFGSLEIELYPEQAPITVANFLQYVDEGFYNNVLFHRLVKNFVIQGGGYTLDFKEKENHAPIKNESNNGLSNTVFTLSMARTNAPDSATSQFFINLVDNSRHLDAVVDPDGQVKRWGYAVFGKVVKGFEVLPQVEKKKVKAMDIPVETLYIESVERI